MEQIQKFLKKRFNLSDNDWVIFSSKLIQERFKKSEIILNSGEVERHLSFVESGVVRQYIPGIENDLTFGFIFKDSFVSAYDSFLTRESSKYAVQAIDDTVLWRISYEDLQVVYTESEIGNLIGRKASEELFLLKCNRELSLLNDTAEERYKKLFTERPELLQKIPLKYIASYIGVTPQALSRIRRRIS